MPNLPTARDLNAMLLLAPSVHPTGPAGNYSIAGSMSFENLFLVNGVTVNENLRGQAYRPLHRGRDPGDDRRHRRHLRRVRPLRRRRGQRHHQVGRQQFSGSFRDTLNNDNWRKMTPFEESPTRGVNAGRDLRIDKVVPTYEYTFGGPVMRDRLWFFTAGRLQKQESGRNTAITGIPYTFVEDTKRYEFKGTYALNSSHRFQGAYTKHAADAGEQHVQPEPVDGPAQPRRRASCPRTASRSTTPAS